MLWFQRFLRNVKIQLRSEDMINSIFGGLDFYMENIGVIFGVFFTIFAYKIFNIDVESTKIVSKMKNMMESQKKSWRLNFLKISVKIDQILTKSAIFYKNVIYSK